MIMAFNLATWKEKVGERLQSWRPRAKKAGVDSVYFSLSLASLWPLVEATRGPEGWAALGPLFTILSGVGTNLLATMIQNWKDEADATASLQAAETDPRLRAELDAVMKELDTLVLAQQSMAESDRQWFEETLKKELAQLGSSLTINSGGGTVVMGDVTVKDGDAVMRDKIIQEIVDQSVSIEGGSIGSVIIQTDRSSFSLSAIQSEEIFISAYYQALAERCRDLPLGLVHQKFAQTSKRIDIPLDAVYTDLDVLRPIQDQDEKDFRQKGLRMERGEGEGRQPLLKALCDEEHRRMVLLGGPGSGKTTFVNYLTYALVSAARGRSVDLPDTLRNLLPVRILLRDVAALTPNKTHKVTVDVLWQTVRRGMEESIGCDAARVAFPALQKRLMNEGGMLLLDGLDEVPEANEQRQSLVEALERWIDCFKNTPFRVLVTARPYAYADPAWRLPGFDVRLLAPFNEKQVSHFIQEWYRSICPVIGLSKEAAAVRAKKLVLEI